MAKVMTMIIMMKIKSIIIKKTNKEIGSVRGFVQKAAKQEKHKS